MLSDLSLLLIVFTAIASSGWFFSYVEKRTLWVRTEEIRRYIASEIKHDSTRGCSGSVTKWADHILAILDQ
jgi:hypothetical protein